MKKKSHQPAAKNKCLTTLTLTQNFCPLSQVQNCIKNKGLKKGSKKVETSQGFNDRHSECQRGACCGAREYSSSQVSFFFQFFFSGLHQHVIAKKPLLSSQVFF
jgi:hypothetical protein